MTLNIDVKTIPHNEQRYDTVGDWFDRDGTCHFRISDCKNRKYEWMIAIHEMVERMLCEVNGVSQESVDAFDVSYTQDSDPGDATRSPYRTEHCYATAVERMLCAAMGLSWKEYDTFLEGLT